MQRVLGKLVKLCCYITSVFLQDMISTLLEKSQDILDALDLYTHADIHLMQTVLLYMTPLTFFFVLIKLPQLIYTDTQQLMIVKSCLTISTVILLVRIGCSSICEYVNTYMHIQAGGCCCTSFLNKQTERFYDDLKLLNVGHSQNPSGVYCVYVRHFLFIPKYFYRSVLMCEDSPAKLKQLHLFCQCRLVCIYIYTGKCKQVLCVSV